MSFIFTLLAGFPNLLLPTLLGWVMWLALLGLIIFLIIQWRGMQSAWSARAWGLFIGLLIFVPITNLFIGVRLPAGSALPLPNFPADYSPGSSMMLFSAVPWILAGGFLGPIGAAVLGLIAGILRGAWDTYNLFSALELALLAVLFSAGVRQRYRTTIYQWMRQPLVSALLMIPLHLVLFILGAFFSIPSNVSVAARLDFALSNSGIAALAFAGEMLIAGVIAQFALTVFPSAWGGKQPLQPSPAERSVETRFVYATGTFVIILLLTLLIGDWVVAGRAADGLLKDRLASTAQAAAQNVPFFLETGQNLAVQLSSDPRLLSSNDPGLSALLAQRMQAVPYFDQFFVLDASGKNLLSAYPDSARQNFSLYAQESAGVSLADNGVLTQIYTIPSTSAADSARVSFLVAVQDGSHHTQRVLIGRTTLSTNPLIQPLTKTLDGLSSSELNGDGLLLDENNNVIYQTGGRTTASYNGPRNDQPSFSNSTAPDGTRQMVYYQPVEGGPWAIVLTIPASQVQQLALNIALPMSVMIILLAIIVLISLRVGLRVITGSLYGLASEANRIAQGKLDHPLQTTGVDEVGQLRRAFEQMRVSLAARLDELNRLLVVSQGVASSLEMRAVVQPVLEAVASSGANAVQVVLLPSILPETPAELPTRFAVGLAKDSYTHLDEQILEMARKQDRIVFPNLSRTRELTLDPKRLHPGALLAVPLRHENRYYGVLWAAYEQPHNFSEADVRFAATLAAQTSLAVSNARLYLNVEVARRQLEAIINSTPDPVLVTDQRNRLLFVNRTAAVSFNINMSNTMGLSIDRVISQKPLVDLLLASSEKQSAEVILPDKRTYLATASSVMAEGRPMGRVCILRDITYFKEIDTMKSEFVSTVSHDLRSPLTLMRGYATMLDMMGNLNEQQRGYTKKIISGVENMSSLVSNLLDLGRIEVGVGLQVEIVSPLDILQRATNLLQLQAAEKKIVLNLEIPKNLPDAMEADQALLHQAVYNLIENAIKYTPENGTVTVRVKAIANDLLFEVHDTGIGIAPDDLPHLFEKFYRGKQREARAQHGSGLGLAIVKSIAEQHHGRVWVESELGKGSAFFLQVPLVQPNEKHPAG
jgi:two-component system phosphate regulon sensor histidine kinase PhoR